MHACLWWKIQKPKVKEFNGVIKTNIIGDEILKESTHCACLAYITTGFAMRIKKKELSTGLFRRVQIQNKENEDD